MDFVLDSLSDKDLVLDEANELLGDINNIIVQNNVNKALYNNLESSILRTQNNIDLLDKELLVEKKAIKLLQGLSDARVEKSKETIERLINDALGLIFKNKSRKVYLREYRAKGTYPQLEIKILNEKGKERSLKVTSGHGIAQVVSFLCIVSLIIFTNKRRFMAIDEVLSGLHISARKVMDSILDALVEAGFQFVINEHDYIPLNGTVVQLEMQNGVTNVSNTVEMQVE